MVRKIPSGSQGGLPGLLSGWCGGKHWKVCNFQNILFLFQVESYILRSDRIGGLSTLSLEKVANEGLAKQACKQATPDCGQSVDFRGEKQGERRQEGFSLRLD